MLLIKIELECSPLIIFVITILFLLHDAIIKCKNMKLSMSTGPETMTIMGLSIVPTGYRFSDATSIFPFHYKNHMTRDNCTREIEEYCKLHTVALIARYTPSDHFYNQSFLIAFNPPQTMLNSMVY